MIDNEKYDNGEVLGVRVMDQVCVVGPQEDPDGNTCVDDFKFLMITE